MKTTVVNKYHKLHYDVYIGRGSKWGNPFSHLDNTKAQFKVNTREESIEKYREWIITQPNLLADLHELKGKVLCCYCKPQSCHGDVLAELADNIEYKSCCFTGHRPNKLYGYDPNTKGNRKLLWKLRDEIVNHIEQHNVDTFISGMALGIDIWAARIVLKLKETYPHVKLIAAVPCKNQSNKWSEQSQKEWQHVINICDQVHYVSEDEYTAWCMQKRNEWMVDNSNYIITVWDSTKGGTANCVNYALKQNKHITKLNPKDISL